ncbi:Cysteine protease, C1A family [Selenomonas sp. WCT3]|uniref:C1 family peptidase n=1 Tax=Selenomonas sp. WCT3 TaxID=3158785 RepID=UPI00088237A9|nr:Cysteine protease, C1A family [Selenomonas ruminantium]
MMGKMAKGFWVSLFVPLLLPTAVFAQEAPAAKSLPAFYDMRLANPFDRFSYFDGRKSLLNEVGNQGSANICWAFTAATAMESNVYKNWQRQGVAYSVDGRGVHLSPWKMAWLSYARPVAQPGILTGAMGKPLRKGSYAVPLASRVYGHGSWPLFAPEFLAGSGIGFRQARASVSEDMKAPADWGEDAGIRLRNVFTSTGRKLYQPAEIARMKSMMLAYGALAAGINSLPLQQKEAVDYYRNKPLPVNHGVNIIGWDDSYDFSKSGLKVKPKHKGAWIIRNSWGKGWGDGGYAYLSYEDKTLGNYVAYDTSLNTAAFDWIDTYERSNSLAPPQQNWENGSGPRYRQVESGSGFAAGYQAKDAGRLQAVGFYALADGLEYTITIRQGSLDPKQGTLALVQQGCFGEDNTPEWAGYRTVKLSSEVSLAAGEAYTVAVELRNPKGKVRLVMSPQLIESRKVGEVHSYIRRGRHGSWQKTIPKSDGDQSVWNRNSSVIQRVYVKAAEKRIQQKRPA